MMVTMKPLTVLYRSLHSFYGRFVELTSFVSSMFDAELEMLVLASNPHVDNKTPWHLRFGRIPNFLW